STMTKILAATEVTPTTVLFDAESERESVRVSSLIRPLLQSEDQSSGSSILGGFYGTIMGFKRHGMHGDDDLPWPLHLLHILFGYSLVVIPVALFIRYVRQKARDSLSTHESSSLLARAVRAFALGRPEYQLLGGEETKKDESWSPHRVFLLLTMFMGIQLSLVTMGYLQEEVMTTAYQRTDDTEQFDRFGDGQFLIFCNRIVALAVCAVVMAATWRRQPPHVPPFYHHSFSSFSNTMSSWCQYEALKYVSFPTQTICKASKVPATMIMGRIVRKERYTRTEYLCGLGITLGASIFLLSAPSEGGTKEEGSTATTISGIILMVGYLSFDAFTPNWQKVLLDAKPRVSKIQMMLGTNLFSAVLCAVSLWEQGSLSSSFSFVITHNGFAKDAFLLSLSGAVGQVFIYSTIAEFGTITLAVIMTVRQMISIILSTLSYGHPMTPWGAIGFCIAFISIFGDSYRKYYMKK
ncbi:hypothetical protein PENTCL1PPCAC_2615, partial [Pristionchus entomophagus]